MNLALFIAHLMLLVNSNIITVIIEKVEYWKV